MLLWASSSYRIRSSSPNKWPNREALVPYPLGNTIAASVPRNWASSSSSSSRIEWLPPTSRLADALQPNWSIAALALSITSGMARQTQVVEAGVIDDLAAGDGGHAMADALAGAEERILQSGGSRAGQTFVERDAFGKLSHVVVRGGNRRDPPPGASQRQAAAGRPTWPLRQGMRAGRCSPPDPRRSPCRTTTLRGTASQTASRSGSLRP